MAGNQFPDGFLWGTSSAAHQVEGDDRNCDWWEFEQEPGRILNGDTPGPTCPNMRRLIFHHVTRPLYPLDEVRSPRRT